MNGLSVRAASRQFRHAAEILVFGYGGIVHPQRVAASDQAQGRAAILDAHNAMRVKQAGSGGKDDMAGPDACNWFTADQENVSRENCREHAATRRPESQLSEIAQDFRCELQAQRLARGHRGRLQ